MLHEEQDRGDEQWAVPLQGEVDGGSDEAD